MSELRPNPTASAASRPNPAPTSIDEYIAAFSPEVQAILQRVRLTISKAAPEARETISYRIPAFTLSGALVYFAAFKKHIGFYPPVRGDAKLEKALSGYAGEKGNLRFPLEQPIPYNLIERIVKLRVKQNLAKKPAKTRKGEGSSRRSMPSRTASCSCGQLRIRVEGEPRGVGICHCLACQQRTGSVFAALASFSAPFDVFGTATEFVRLGDQGARFIFRFCPVCGTTVFHTEDGRTESVSIAVGAFADPSFPAPRVSIYDSRRHPWVELPPGIKTFDKDPT